MKKGYLVVLLGNVWIWRVLSESVLLGGLVLVTSWLLYSVIIEKKERYAKLLLMLLGLVLVFQWRMTAKRSLYLLSNDEQRVVAMRLREYPVKYLRVGHWIEERREAIAFFRIQNYLGEVLDINLYFFANHPRERVGFNEFEKFPYLLLPFFIYGAFLFWRRHWKWLIIVFGLPLAMMAVIGSQSPVGPVGFFPGLFLVIGMGVERFYRSKSRMVIRGSLAVYLLVLVQIVSYALY